MDARWKPEVRLRKITTPKIAVAAIAVRRVRLILSVVFQNEGRMGIGPQHGASRALRA
jgi:hypothetical protein